MPGDFPTRLDLFSIARDYVATRAKRLDPAQVDIEGSDINLYVGAASFVANQVVLSLIQNVNALLLDGADGEDLDRYALDHYQLARKGASPALGLVRIYRATTAAGAGTVDSGTKLLTLNGIEYVTTGPASFGVGDVQASAIPVRAVQAGKNSQVGANQIRQFASPPALFDSSLQVNNDVASAGGEDAEIDDVFRERIRGFWQTARRGTLTAIEFGATATEGVVSASATEVLTAEPRPARVVLLNIADSSGVANVALGQATLITLDEYRAAGIAVIPNASVPQIISITLKLTFVANVDTTTIADQIRAAVNDFVNGLGVNQPLLRADLYSVLQRFRSNGLVVDQATLVAPTGDLVPDPGFTIRTRLQNVTVA